MVDYSKIYDVVCDTHKGYQSARGSPGYQFCRAYGERLREQGPRHLDVGCGQGFAVELMRGPEFNKTSFGVDVSPRMIQVASERLRPEFFRLIEDAKIPFPDNHFDIVTCFDVLEHLDEQDAIALTEEITRSMAPDGVAVMSISLRPSISVDIFGDNLHRTVKSADWWKSIIEFDEVELTPSGGTMVGWIVG